MLVLVMLGGFVFCWNIGYRVRYLECMNPKYYVGLSKRSLGIEGKFYIRQIVSAYNNYLY